MPLLGQSPAANYLCVWRIISSQIVVSQEPFFGLDEECLAVEANEGDGSTRPSIAAAGGSLG